MECKMVDNAKLEGQWDICHILHNDGDKDALLSTTATAADADAVAITIIISPFEATRDFDL